MIGCHISREPKLWVQNVHDSIFDLAELDLDGKLLAAKLLQQSVELVDDKLRLAAQRIVTPPVCSRTVDNPSPVNQLIRLR